MSETTEQAAEAPVVVTREGRVGSILLENCFSYYCGHSRWTGTHWRSPHR